MVYNKYFLLVIFCSSIIGIILSFLNNSLVDQKYTNDNNNNIKEHSKKENKEKKTKEEEQDKDKKNNQNIENKLVNNHNENINKKKKLRIATAYATDNTYIYPTIVAMTSLVDTAGNNTFYKIYVMHTPDFTIKSKNFLKTVENKYPDKCIVVFFDMGNKYKGLKLNFRISEPTYYRLSLQDILPYEKRIIWMETPWYLKI